MRLGVRGKLFVASVGLIVVAGGAAALFLEKKLHALLDARIQGELFDSARTAREVLRIVQPETREHFDALADQLARAAAERNIRLTFIAADGTLLGDSDLTVAELAAAGSHADRPEVVQARKEGSGIAKRHSASIDSDLLYAAVPAETPRPIVVRASMPLDEVSAAIRDLHVMIAFAGLLGLAAATLMSAFASHMAARALARLVDRTREVAHGLGRGLDVTSADEVGVLEGSFQRIAQELGRTVDELAKERARFEAVLTTMNDGVVALDPEGRVTLANPAAASLLGLTPKDVGTPLIERVRDPTLLDAAARAADAPASAEVVLRGRNVSIHGAPLPRAGGVALVLSDVTDVRRLETVRRDFVANASHELRTPVSIIQMNAETLLSGALEDPSHSRELVEALGRSAERLARLVGDLLDLSRIESESYRVELTEVPVGDAVDRAIDGVARRAAAKTQELKVEVPGDLSVHADTKALDQVLLNLVDNAVKYTPAGGHILVRAAQAEDQVRIEVIDDGPGLDLRHRKRVFERFYRVDPGRSRELGGTGLGLAIVKHLVEAMRGDVGVEPGSPRGAKFWVNLPLHPQPAAGGQSVPRDGVPAIRETRRT